MTEPVWSTFIYTAQVENHEEIYKEFKPFLDDADNFGDTWVFGNALSTIRKNSNDKFPWKVWFDGVRPYVEEHLCQLEPTTGYVIHSDEFWVNMYYETHFQEPHDHSFPGRVLSAIYVMEFPEDEDPGGQLVFECPNYNMIKATGINKIFAKYQYQHIMPKLIPGTLILFPSWIQHYVLQSKSKQRRTTIAANFCIEEAKNDQTQRTD